MEPLNCHHLDRCPDCMEKHESLRAEVARLLEIINWAGESAIDFFYYTNDFNDDYPAFDRGFKEELDRRALSSLGRLRGEGK